MGPIPSEVWTLALQIVDRGWQGLMTLFVARWLMTEWKFKKAANGKGVKHNPSPEIHAAIDVAVSSAVGPIKSDISGLGERVARIEGRLDVIQFKS